MNVSEKNSEIIPILDLLLSNDFKTEHTNPYVPFSIM